MKFTIESPANEERYPNIRHRLSAKGRTSFKLVKLMKPLKIFAASGFGSKTFINFPLCCVE